MHKTPRPLEDYDVASDGPWHVEQMPGNAFSIDAQKGMSPNLYKRFFIVRDCGPNHGEPLACTVPRHIEYSLTDERNARLMAAAPELFEALSAMLKYVRRLNTSTNKPWVNAKEEIDRADSAISKALGDNK